MSEFTIALIVLFASIALLSGTATSLVLGRTAPGRRRLFALGSAGSQSGVFVDDPLLVDALSEQQKRLAAYIPKSPKDMSRLQRRLAMAGYHGFKAALVYSLAEIVLAALGFIIVFFVAGLRTGWLFGIGGAVIGFLMPGFFVARKVSLRKKQIQNGLPDALDLLIISLEAGLALDQALLKCSEELAISYPALAHEFSMINIETRAGKPRLEALKNFSRRTQVDDARALVTMLVQTDRFGTSVAQALRTHAEESRIKRRQRAEEKAAKLSVKLIFPLVFCLLPAFFVVVVGPALIKFVDFFSNTDFGGIGK
jgi:tight adherence protein C